MISSPLFRPGDRVRYRIDLQVDTYYPMLHDLSLECYFGTYAYGWFLGRNGTTVTITDISPMGRYQIGRLDIFTDGLFVEGSRVMRFLAPADYSQF